MKLIERVQTSSSKIDLEREIRERERIERAQREEERRRQKEIEQQKLKESQRRLK